MVRRGRQSLNSSVVTNSGGNVSVLEDEYNRLADRLSKTTREIKITGYKETITSIEKEIDTLINGTGEPEFFLLTGPPGTGKTSLIKKLAARPDLTFLFLKSEWALERRFGNPESMIEKIFEEAVNKAPSLIFIDNIHMICSDKRNELKISAVLQDELEFLKSRACKVLVYAATNAPEQLDPQMRKHNYFRKEIKLSLPKKQDRVEILRHLTNQNLDEQELELLADASHCYSYTDLEDVCKSVGKQLSSSTLRKALSNHKPALVESITTPCPPLHWDDIGGVEAVKKKLQHSIIWPLKHRDKFQKLGIGSRKGAILYGPPGCSKTMLARALATESGFNFICIKGPELYSKYVGDSEAAVRTLYRNAREIAPSIIFFDEIDGFTPNRNDNQTSSVGDKVVTQLLTELDGIEPLHNVYTIAATNRPDRVDSALLRPGRLAPAIYIPLPSESDRKEIFKVHLKPLAVNFGEVPLETVVDNLAAKTRGYSGAEIAEVCGTAGDLALEENIDTEFIELKHLEQAINVVRPSTEPEQLKVYRKFQRVSLQPGKETEKKSLVNKLRRSLRIR